MLAAKTITAKVPVSASWLVTLARSEAPVLVGTENMVGVFGFLVVPFTHGIIIAYLVLISKLHGLALQSLYFPFGDIH